MATRLHNIANVLFVLAICCSPTVATAFVVSTRWSSTASGDTTDVGNSVTLNWGIAPDGTPASGKEQSQLVTFLDREFGVDAADENYAERPWFDLIQSAFERWEELGGVRFDYEPNDDGGGIEDNPGELGTRGDIRLAGIAVDGPRGVLATGRSPDSGDIIVDTSGGVYLLDPADEYRRFRNVLMHEIGHALGLGHIYSSDAQFLMEPELTIAIDGPQLDDIRGLHYLYGDRYEASHNGAGNDRLSEATPLGNLTSLQTIAIGSDAATGVQIAQTDWDFLSLSNGSDRDFYSFDVTTPGWLDILLTPEGVAYYQGVSAENESLIYPVATSNLSFAVYGADGQRLSMIDDHLHGVAERLTHFYLPSAGTYSVEVRGTRQSVQLYQLELAMVTQAVPEPANVYLAISAACLGCALRWRCKLVRLRD